MNVELRTSTVHPSGTTARRSRKTARKKQNREIIISLLGLAIITVFAYGNSFRGAFVFDDGNAILSNPRIRPPLTAAGLFSVLPPGPIVTVTLAVNYALGELNPWGYHALNLLIHIGAGLTLFGIIRRTLLLLPCRRAAAALAFSAASIWLVHPLQTESVTYIVQRYESLMGLFYLLTLYCAIRGARVGRPGWWYAGAVLACALGMATKESAVTAPVAVIIYDRIFLSRRKRRRPANRMILYTGLAATWFFLFLIVREKPYAVWGGFGYQEISPVKYALSQFGVICRYLRLSFLPGPLCLDYGWPVSHRLITIIPSAIIIGGALILTIRGVVMKSPFAFPGAWFFLTLAPTSSIIPISDLAFEHRMYLPLAAVTVLVVIGVRALLLRLFPDHPSRRKYTGVVLMVVIIPALAVLTFQRNRAYFSPVTMWSDVVSKRPGNPRAQYNLGNALAEEGKAAAAVDHYRRAISLRPDYGDAFYNLAISLEDLGRPEEAVVWYQRALALNPDSAQIRNNLGAALLATGREEEAAVHLRDAVRLDPDLAEAGINLANLSARHGDREGAISAYRAILAKNPDSAEAHYNLGVTLALEGQPGPAEAQYREAIRLDPRNAEAWYNLALLLEGRDEGNEAMECLRRALLLDPGFSGAKAALERMEKAVIGHQ